MTIQAIVEALASDLEERLLISSNSDAFDGTTQLTPQELQVALAIARGFTSRETGAQLNLSTKTVEAHLSRVYQKYGIRSRSQLTALVIDYLLAVAHGAR